MDPITKNIYSQVANKSLNQDEAKSLLMELKKMGSQSVDQEDIAIIGMACEFPKAKNINEFWENIVGGKNCIDKLPENRKKDTDDYFKSFHYQQLLDDGLISSEGDIDLDYEIRGYLPEVDKFDADFFDILPREANAMDPKQRQLLKLTHSALETAGLCKDNIWGTNTGVFFGLDHVCEIKYKQIAREDPLVVTGTWPGLLASRISFLYNLNGPCLITDTACSSGLVSVNLACKSIKAGDCKMAIAGGLSSVFYKPYKFSDESKDLDAIESTDNTVYTFDKKANGTVWGEGAGVVVLKSLKAALDEGDVIHGIIKGHGINNDGASNGITAPDARAQEELFLDVWERSRINPESIEYIEAHGTGTILGDPIEIKSLNNAFRKYTQKKQFCGIGSVKTNIGHTVGASGLAALLKVVLMLKNRKIAPCLNFSEPNPYIDLNDSPLYISDRVDDWKRGEHPLRGAVNSFGFAGTNCHVVLEEAPEKSRSFKRENRTHHFFTVSAKNMYSLRKLIQQTFDFIDGDRSLMLDDLCFTSNVGRGHYGYRMVFLVSSLEELVRALDDCRKGDPESSRQKNIYFGFHKMVSDKKENRSSTELTEAERRQLNGRVGTLIDGLVFGNEEEGVEEICRSYIRGATIEWVKIYQKKRKRISLPSYPYELKRFWFEKEEVKREAPRGYHVKEIAHPLIDRCAVKTDDRDVYITQFSEDRHWVIEEHVIVEQNVIPGITYIEMIREIARIYFGDSPVVIRDMYFMIPALFKRHEQREVQTMVTDIQRDSFSFRCLSRDEDGNWVNHVEGAVKTFQENRARSLDRGDLLSRIEREEPFVDLNRKGNQNLIELGPRWQCEEVAAVGEKEIMIDLKLPKPFLGDLDEYRLHPALLDNAINGVSQRLGAGLYLPFMYKEIIIMGDIPGEFHSLVSVKNHRDIKDHLSPEVLTFDVSLFDSDNNVFISISDYKMKSVDVDKSSFNQQKVTGENAFTVDWIRKDSGKNDVPTGEGEYLLLQNLPSPSDLCGFFPEDFTEKLLMLESLNLSGLTEGKERGFSIEEYGDILGKIVEKGIFRIIYSCVEDESSLSTESVDCGLNDFFNLIKAALQVKLSSPLHISVLFRNVYSVNGREEHLFPQFAGLSQFSKTVMEECPYINIKCIDMGDSSGGVITGEMERKSPEVTVAYRRGERFVQEFVKSPIERREKLVIFPDPVYLITGGTGGIGLTCGSFLVSKGARNICITGRSVIPGRDEWDRILQEDNSKLKRLIEGIRAMEKEGASVVYEQVDVCNCGSMKSMTEDLRKRFGRIAGVFHCAGIGGQGVLLNKEMEVFKSVVEPKMLGTWIIDFLTREDKPDFMVLYSSILSLFPEAGQSDYSSANGFMDAFADYRNKEGFKTVSINWPPWLETGMAVDFGINFSNTLFRPLTNDAALFFLERILESGCSRILPGKINFPELAKRKDRIPYVFSPAINSQLKILDRKAGTPQEKVQVVLKGKDQGSYDEIENRIARIWASVLGVKEIDIYDTLTSLGGDSLIAIELHKKINTSFPGILDISDIFSYPSVNQLVEFIKSSIGESSDKDGAPGEEEQKRSVDDELRSVLDNIDSDDASLESALERINDLF